MKSSRQFILGMGLLVSVLLVLILLKLAGVRQQARSVDRITASFGSVTYDWELSGEAMPPGPAWLRRLIGDDWFQTVVGVSFSGLSGHAADDAAVEPVANLPHLRSVSITFTGQISARSIQILSKLPMLEELELVVVSVKDNDLKWLEKTTTLKRLTIGGISDRGLQHLLANSRLEDLRLSDSEISDQGAELISTFQRLKILSISKSDITDRGMKLIAKIRGLQQLDISSTSISDESVPTLLEMPDLFILNFENSKISEPKRHQLSRRFVLARVNTDLEDAREDFVRQLDLQPATQR